MALASSLLIALVILVPALSPIGIPTGPFPHDGPRAQDAAIASRVLPPVLRKPRRALTILRGAAVWRSHRGAADPCGSRPRGAGPAVEPGRGPARIGAGPDDAPYALRRFPRGRCMTGSAAQPSAPSRDAVDVRYRAFDPV
jgi:hypothetical protein